MVEKRFVGYIIGEASTTEFEFVTDKENIPMKWDYLLVESTEKLEGKKIEVKILSQVSEIYGFSKNVTIDTLPSAVKKQIEQNVVNVKLYGKARILGYLDEKKVIRMPRRNRIPGEEVFLADPKLLKNYFSKKEHEGLNIGTLITNSEVDVYLDPNGLNRHLAILAQTGAGKSYTTGVVIEELYKKGATILIIDPHSDYVFLGLKEDGSPVERNKNITVYRNPSSTGRYDLSLIPNPKVYQINFGELDEDEIAELSGIPSNATNIKEHIRDAIDRLKVENYSPNDLINKLEEMKTISTNSKEKGTIQSALNRLNRLKKIRVFGNSDIPIKSILTPWSLSVIDLSGLSDDSMTYVASKLLNEAYNYALNEATFPIFIVIEEAHKFIPPLNKKSTFCSQIINTIAAEGRKFGLFLILITQRPSKIDSDSLSQCNSQIIMKVTNPQDQTAILNSSERATEVLLIDLPGLSPGEAIITGDIVKVPVMVSIRRRTTKEGGADINILNELRKARENNEIKEQSEAEKEKRQNSTPNPFNF